MAADLVLLYPCAVKTSLGDGDADAGTDRLLECLKARSRAETIAEVYTQRGESPQGKSIELRLFHATQGTETRQVSYEDFLAQAAPLVPLEGHCRGCPANFQGQPFGCIGVVNYPIPRVAQEWLLDRIEPPGSLGGQFFLRGLDDFNYTGERMRSLRTSGLVEGEEPPTRILHISPGATRAVTVDQIFEAILCIEGPLNPSHCLLVLLWLGALTVEGVPLASLDQMRALLELQTTTEREQHVGLNLGPPSDESSIRSLQVLLEGMFAAWVLETPLWVWA